MNNLENKYESLALKKDDILLFSKQIALDFIRDCESMKIKILGIDGFFIYDNKIQPSMENSIDFSNYYSSIKENIYSESLNFVKKQPENCYFEIVCE